MMPRIIADHPDVLAAITNAQLRAAGVENLRTDMHLLADFRARIDAAATADAAAGEPDAPKPTSAPAASPSAAEALNARLVAVLRSPQARSKTGAALALALRTDMDTDQIAATLRDLPEGVDLRLPSRAIADPDVKAEADRIRQIVTADAAAGHHDHALALALDTDITAAAALAILGAMPQPKRIASIEERAREMAEFGPSDFSMEETHGDRTASGWSKAVAKANARLEAAAPTSATDPQAPGGPRFGADQ
jgi:hypothetical protein